MTGYGKAIAECPDKNVVIEIKSLNSKSLDLNTRINYSYREKELEIRTLMSDTIIRGKVDFIVYIESKEGGAEKNINTDLVKAYCKQLQTISNELNISDASVLEIAMRMPDVMVSEPVTQLTKEEWDIVANAIQLAIQNLINYRIQEGEVLGNDVLQNIRTIEKLLAQVDEFEPQRIERIRERMQNAIKEGVAVDKIDTNRFEQELIFYIEKLDVSEEKVRLAQNCLYFVKTMEEQVCGKKLNFIAQEIGREINTLGSKSNDADMQRIVVEMKDCLEKIKEQILNIL